MAVITDKEKRRRGEGEKGRNDERGMMNDELDSHSSLITHHASFSSTPVAVRPYQPEDYPAVLALWEEAKLRPYLKEEIARLLGSGGGALVAVMPSEEHINAGLGTHAESGMNETVAGVVLWSHNGSVGILWRLAVAEHQRGRGIATKLLDRAEEDIRRAGLNGVTLLTRVTNTVAKSMYSKRGYKHNDHLEFWGKKLSE